MEEESGGEEAGGEGNRQGDEAQAGLLSVQGHRFLKQGTTGSMTSFTD